MVEIDDGQDDVVPMLTLPHLRVGDQLVVVGRMEVKSIVELERLVVATDPVDQSDERRKAGRALEVPGPDLVLLRSEVLLRAALAGKVLLQLERRTVDPIVR